MTGEGTGGGGALAALLALWIVAVAFVVAQDPFAEPEPSTAAATPIVSQPGATVIEAPPTPTPRPPLPACEGEACAEPVTRAELARALSRAFRLEPTTNDFFTDDADSPQEPSINRVAAAGITSGCGEDRYCPDGLVTRAQIATFLDRAIGLPATDRNFFTDDDGTTHEAAINRLAASGITSGCGEDRFCPDGAVTLRQLVTFLERALDLDEPSA